MRVLIVEDDRVFRKELADLVETQPGVHRVDQAATAAAARAQLGAGPPPALVLLDLTLPLDDADAKAGGASVVGPALALEARKLAPRARLVVVSGLDRKGAVGLLVDELADDFVSKDFAWPEIQARVLHQLAEARALASDRYETLRGEALIGDSPAMAAVRAWIARAAATAAPVLITGESGCGKELAALAVHRQSPFARGPFVPFHAAAVGEALLEAELFGYRKGAFTGAADDRAGVVESAQGGTLFLDEIGELPPAFQVKLLRFLDSGRYHRLGEDQPRTAKVRLVFATNRDLPAEVAAGRFREDLLHRLDVLRVRIPPLRERPDDLPTLVDHLLARLCAAAGKPPTRCSPAALALLATHRWPGNVRELRNALERALILSDRDVMDPGAFDLAPRPASAPPPPQAPGYLPGTTLEAAMAEAERVFLRAALAHHGANVTATAKALGIGRRTLQEKMERLALRSEP